MRTTLMVATHEFTERLRSRAFLISNAAIMGLLVLAVALPAVFGDDEAIKIGYVGAEAAQVGELAGAQQETFGVDLELVPLADRATAELALENDEVSAVLMDQTTVLADSALGRPLESLLSSASNAVSVDAAMDAAGVDPADRAALFAVDPLTVERLDDAMALDVFSPSIVIVFVAVFLLYGLLAIYGQWVAQGIVEEKQSRVVEVLLSTLQPRELLAGKILGLGALGLAQVLLMVGIGVVGLLISGVIEVPRAAWAALALVVPWYVLGFLLYATVFAVAGAVVSRVEDVQASTMPVIVILVLALFAAQVALSDPSGTVATVVGVFPLTAPMVQPVLFALGATSWVQVLVAFVLTLAAIGAMVPLAGRIYAGGVLRTAGRVSLRQAWSDG